MVDSPSGAPAVRSRDHGPNLAVRKVLAACTLVSLSCAACGDAVSARPPRRDAGSHAQLDAASSDSGESDASTESRCGESAATPVIFLEDNRTIFSSSNQGQGPEQHAVTVTGLGHGFRPGFNSDWLDPADYDYVVLTDEEKTWTIMARGARSFGVALGDAAELRWSFSQGVFYVPPKAQLSLYAQGRLAFSYTIALDVPKGFSLSPGTEQCQGEDVCAKWVSEALIVRGPCGESVEVGSGQRGRVCDYDILPGALKRVTERSVENRLTTCADWWVKGTELTIVRASSEGDGDDAGTEDISR